MKKVAMLQPNYIPWKGVFDMIHKVDIFVFYDDVQYTKKDWRNRNKIPTKDGELWLTVPVLTKGERFQRICDVKINTKENWQEKHYKTLNSVYAKAIFFEQYRSLLEDFYLEHKWENLSEMDIYITKRICKELGIDTEFVVASELGCEGSKDGEKVIKICKELGCDYFINGPAAKAFMDEKKFRDANIMLDYMNYDYPEYPQLTKPFNHYVSILDLLFNMGDNACDYIW